MKKLTGLLLIVALLLLSSALAEGSLRLMEVKQPETTRNIQLYISTDTQPTGDDLTLYRDGQPVSLPMEVQRASEANVGVVYVFCLDISGTISKRDLDEGTQELISFCEQLGESDLMRVYAIGDQATPLTGYTRDVEEVRTALSAIKKRTQNTYLWESVRMAADDLRENRDSLPRLAQLIVFTDGVDDSGNTGSVDLTLQSVRAAGMPLRVVLMNSSDKDASLDDIHALCEQSGGVLFDGRRDFTDGLEQLHQVVGNDYCVTASGLPYDQLTGTSDWYVEQQTEDGVLTSNTMSATLTQEGVPAPVHAVTIYVNDAPVGEEVAELLQDQDNVVRLEADGDVSGYTVALGAGEATVLEGQSASLTLDTSDMRLNDVWTLYAEAQPLSEEPGQTPKAQVQVALQPLPVSQVQLSVDGARMSETAVLPRDASVTIEWQADGDVRASVLTISNGTEERELYRGPDMSCAIPSESLTFGEVYTFAVTVEPYSMAAGQQCVATADATLSPRPVLAVGFGVDALETSGDGVHILPKNSQADLVWTADGDVRSCLITLPNGETVETAESTYTFDTSSMEVGEVYAVTAEVQPWSDAEKQSTHAQLLVSVKPDPITGLSLYADGLPRLGDAVAIPQEGSVHISYDIAGDAADVVLDAPSEISVEAVEGGFELSNASMALGETYSVSASAVPYPYGDAPEEDAAQAALAFALEPIPVTGVTLDHAGTTSVAQGAVENIAWETAGDAKSYTVTVLEDGAAIEEETTEEPTYALDSALMRLGHAYEVRVEAEPWSDAPGQATTASADFALEPIPVTGVTLDHAGTTSVAQGAVENIAWETAGDAKSYTVTVLEDGAAIEETVTEEPTYALDSALMRLGHAYEVQVEAEPWSDAPGQATTASADFALEPIPVTGVTLDHAGTTSVAQGAVEKITWQTAGDAKSYTVTVLEDGAAIEEEVTEKSAYALDSALMRLGHAYEVQVEAEPWSDAPDQDTTASADFTLAPIPVRGVILSQTEQTEVPQGGAAELTWQATGDVKGYTVNTWRDGVLMRSLATKGTSYRLPADAMQLGSTYDVEVKAWPWSDARGQDTTASTRFTLQPIPVTGVKININGEEAGDGAFLLEQGSSAEIRCEAEGDARGFTVSVAGEEGEIPVTQAEDGATVLDASLLTLGEEYTLTATAEPWSEAEGQALTATAVVGLKPRPVTALRLFVDGEPAGGEATVIPYDREATLSWEAEGDAQRYVVRLWNGDERETEETSIAIAGAELTADAPCSVTVAAISMDAEAEPVEATAQLQRTWIPLSNPSWTMEGEPLTVDEEPLQIKEEKVTFAAVASGEVDHIDYTLTDSRGEAVALETNEDGRSVTISRSQVHKSEEYTLTAQIAAKDPASGDLTLPLKLQWPINWLLIACIAGGVLLLLAILLIVLLKRRKKPGPGPDPDHDDEDVEDRNEPKTPAPIVRVITYEQQVPDEPGVQFKHVVQNQATIGRAAGCDIYFKGLDEWVQTVAHKQATLLLDEKGELYIEPGSATNPTEVNGQEIAGRTQLVVGSKIQMGEVHWTILNIEEAYK